MTLTTAPTFPVELRIDAAGLTDLLIVIGAGTPDAGDSVLADDEDRWDLIIPVEPSEDREPYDAALIAAGFEPVGDDAARRL